MAEIVQVVPKDPRDADATLSAVLDDVVARNRRNRKLVRSTIRPTEVELVYETPD